MPAASEVRRPVTSERPRPPWSRALVRLLGPFHVTGIFWCRALVAGSRLPEPFVRVLHATFTALFFCALWGGRRVILANLEPVLGPAGFLERQRRIWRTLYGHAWTLIERFEQYRPRFEPRVTFPGDAWQEVLASDHGWLLLNAHFGNWELGTLMELTHGSRKLHVVREREEHAATQRFVEETLANASPAVVTHFLDDDPCLGATLLAALRRGDLVTLAGDRAREGMESLEVAFFGRTVRAPLGPYALARAAGVPIVPVFLFRTGRRRYEVAARPPITVVCTGDRRADCGEAARRFHAHLEDAVRRAPHHWVRWEVVWQDAVGERRAAGHLDSAAVS